MKAIGANLTFFFDEETVEEPKVRHRLESLLQAEFGDLEDWTVHWLEDTREAQAGTEDLTEKLERLDT